MIYELVVESNKSNPYAMLKLINQFNPILKKYAFRLNYEDAYNDLITEFIESIKKINFQKLYSREDGRLVAYVTTIIRNCYIKISKRIKKEKIEIIESNLSESQQNYMQKKLSTYDNYFMDDILNPLTSKGKIVIYLIYFKQYTVEEVADYLCITRQAVNQIKQRSLYKIKTLYFNML